MPQTDSLIDLLPPKAEVDHLVQIYLQTFDHIYHILHQPTFDRDYTLFWMEPTDVEPEFVVLLLFVVSVAYLTSAQQRHLEEDIGRRRACGG